MTHAKMKAAALLVAVLTVFLASGCGSSKSQVLATGESQVKLRSIQTRTFDTTDKEHVLRVIITTMQDLGFVVDKADMELGTVSATKLDGYQLRLTANARPRGETQILVRANAQYQNTAVEDPKPYQDFFVALEKAMFLEAHQVE